MVEVGMFLALETNLERRCLVGIEGAFITGDGKELNLQTRHLISHEGGEEGDEGQGARLRPAVDEMVGVLMLFMGMG
ncbi:MAG: hypothetical protein ACYTGH_21890, partial [Planctomycetota bacterium]